MAFSQIITDIAAEAEKALAPAFAEFDRIAQVNTERVLESFREHRVSDSMFGGSTGYGMNNIRSAVERAVGADILFKE